MSPSHLEAKSRLNYNEEAMALETLKYVNKIGEVNIAHHYLDPDQVFCFTKIDEHITVNHAENSIKFDIQDGPIKENGVNGCQIDDMVHVAMVIIKKLNDKYPCEENSQAISCLSQALKHLDDRTKNREKRGVEGTSIK